MEITCHGQIPSRAHEYDAGVDLESAETTNIRSGGLPGWAQGANMHGLSSLITAAMQLAGTEDQISHNARLWQMEGGRACPLEWGGCSQPVYVDLKTGEYDYGEPGGPGHADCMANCRHGMNPPPCDDWDDVPNAKAVGLDAAGGQSHTSDGLCGNGSEVGAGDTAVESEPERDIHAELTLAAFHREVTK